MHKASKQTHDMNRLQYLNQTNLVYIGTIVMASVMILLMFFIGNLFLVVLNVIGALVAVTSLWLNYKGKYTAASLVFIVTITFNSSAHAVMFGVGAGFAYYFLNQAGLIIYTNWRMSWKFFGVFVQVSLLILVFAVDIRFGPRITLAASYALFLHGLNGMLNIIGVANSARYFLNIATQANQTLFKLAYTDYLTSLPNRTTLETLINDVAHEQKQKQLGFGLLMIDVDHFKSINDRYGHIFGDQVLQHIAEILKKNSDDEQKIARYGGEEFVMVTRCDSLKCAHAKAELLRNLIASSTLKHREEEVKITVSIGAVFVKCDNQQSNQDLLDLADACMYKAKQRGRNQVVSLNQ